MTMRPAAELLLLEAAAIEPILQGTADIDFDRPTVCDGWSVRDVMAHCAAALTMTAAGEFHGFTPEENQADVDARRGQGIGQVLAELLEGYEHGAAAIDAADGRLDGIGIGEWMHGGDIRDALEIADAYESDGIELAIDLLIERSQALSRPGVSVLLEDRRYDFGVGPATAILTTDRPTFVRICGGRRPDPGRYRVDGEYSVADMVLFN